MENRVRAFLKEAGAAREPRNDFWQIYTDGCRYVVTEDVAVHVMRTLARARKPKWVWFCDFFGSRHQLRTDAVLSVEESTEDQRARWRAFRRLLKKEDNEDEQPWGE